LQPTAAQLAALTAVINEHERGLIVCGPRCPGGEFAAAVAALSRGCGYPILADPVSGVRFGGQVVDTAVVGGYDGFLSGRPSGWAEGTSAWAEGPSTWVEGTAPWPEAEVIIRLGDVPTSNHLNNYLERIAARHRIYINESGAWADDSHRTSAYVQANPAVVCERLAEQIEGRAGSAWADQVMAVENRYWPALAAMIGQSFFDGTAVFDLVNLLPDNATLFIGNSLPIRHVDQFGRPSHKRIRAFANRGASGIDGNISTGLGLAADNSAPLVLLVGDVTFYHDMNGLLALQERPFANRPVTIVLLNNDGGAIFHRLPVARFEPAFTRLFVTPHGLDFAPAAQLYGLEFSRVTTREAFRVAFSASLSQPAHHLIEVQTDGRRDFQQQKAVMARIISHMTTNETTEKS
jgi:2-succinyl-5-enolpyruvyl-6-hydroxy-3-cyclohexene-1-carboxylate synthase